MIIISKEMLLSYLPDTIETGKGKEYSNSWRECRVYHILSKMIGALWEEALHVH